MNEFRNLTRVYLFSKGLKKAKKQGLVPECFKGVHFIVLMAIALHDGIHVLGLYRHFKRIGRSMPVEAMYKRTFPDLFANGFISVDERKKYRVTLTGRLFLKRFEALLRKERWDR